ncbi:hypothetical protein [Jidongwangia harbinensis]|uniref:hypothetical protein n=1 Tax=Jidongwangia harbinensis TaxID=2878561 RepID=UPI001CD954E7|nr:hypothetical protein [Jidongwangia harbinensis]MCA2213790.1 hypothetical protein [Jidongwangia harbinensis]
MRLDQLRTGPLGRLLLTAVLVTSACEPAGQPEPVGLTGGWATAGCELARRPETVTVGGRAMLVTPPALAAAMARIEEGGRADFADSYAGLEVNQEHVRAVVYRVPSAAFDDFIRRAAEDTCVLVRDAAHARAELVGWQERVAADLDAWAGAGVPIATVGARHDGAGVEVGTPDVSRTRRALTARYGRTAPLIFVEQGAVTPLSAPPPPDGPPTAPQPGG